MAKNSSRFVCNDCGWETVKWVGRCGGCGAWASLEEEKTVPTSARAPVALAPHTPAQPITDIPAVASKRTGTDVAELDRVLGGGLVPGAVVLLAGEPGVGKSTLVLDMAGRAARRARDAGENPVLYVTGEESASQVRLRAERIGAMDTHLHLASESDLATIIGHIHQSVPSLLIIDSVQTIASSEVDGSAGGVAQVKAVSSALVSIAKSRNIPTVLVGHVNKEGSIAGPRVLEHLVDVVLYFEGERHSPLRLVRAVKNRYGATDEVGCFELNDSGIEGLPDPSGLFLSARNRTVAGTCVTVTMEGRRPLLVEVQALVAPACSRPARTVSGIDYSRTHMAIAVLQSRLGLELDKRDVFVSTIGGAKASEPATDAAIALALTSAYMDLPISGGVVCLGEVSLTGELRPITGLQQRLNEAARLGFNIAIIPASSGTASTPKGLEVRECSDIVQAIRSVLPIPQP